MSIKNEFVRQEQAEQEELNEQRKAFEANFNEAELAKLKKQRKIFKGESGLPRWSSIISNFLETFRVSGIFEKLDDALAIVSNTSRPRQFSIVNFPLAIDEDTFSSHVSTYHRERGLFKTPQLKISLVTEGYFEKPEHQIASFDGVRISIDFNKAIRDHFFVAESIAISFFKDGSIFLFSGNEHGADMFDRTKQRTTKILKTEWVNSPDSLNAPIVFAFRHPFKSAFHEDSLGPFDDTPSSGIG